MASKWGSLVKEEHVALHEYMRAFATKAVLQCIMGSYFTDDKEVLAFKHSFDQVSQRVCFWGGKGYAFQTSLTNVYSVLCSNGFVAVVTLNLVQFEILSACMIVVMWFAVNVAVWSSSQTLMCVILWPDLLTCWCKLLIMLVGMLNYSIQLNTIRTWAVGTVIFLAGFRCGLTWCLTLPVGFRCGQNWTVQWYYLFWAPCTYITCCSFCFQGCNQNWNAMHWHELSNSDVSDLYWHYLLASGVVRTLPTLYVGFRWGPDSTNIICWHQVGSKLCWHYLLASGVVRTGTSCPWPRDSLSSKPQGTGVWYR